MRFYKVSGSFLTKIVVQNRYINLCHSLDVGDRDMLVHHMRGRANEAEFEDRAIGADKPRVGCPP